MDPPLETFKAAVMQCSGRGHRLTVQSKELTLAAKAIGDLLCAAVFLTGSTRAEGCDLGVHRAATYKIHDQFFRDADTTSDLYSELLQNFELKWQMQAMNLCHQVT